MRTNQRGEALTAVLLAIIIIGGGAFGLSKTKWFHGDSKRARTSEETTAALVTAVDRQGGVAAASVVKIGEANASAPESPEKTFISREVPVALASLPKPDSEALIAAERRKAAILEGRLQEASLLYGDAMARAEKLEREKGAALSAKRASDQALAQVAAERLGAEQQAFWAFVFLGLVGALYVYTKMTHLSPAAVAAAVTDIKAGTGESNPAIAALDGVTTRLQQKMIRLLTKLKE